MRAGSFTKNVHIMQSGGVLLLLKAKRTPIQTLMSSPINGAVGLNSLSQM